MTDPEDHNAPALPTDDGLAWLAFAELNAGNERYRTMTMKHPQTYHAEMLRLAGAKQQTPTVCILGCADSRVPPEIVFDQGLGDMFVVRVAGNVADDDAQASLEYAVQQFTPPPSLIVVLGHESCGAVQAAAIASKDASVPQAVKAEFEKHHEHSPISRKLNALAGLIMPAVTATREARPDPVHWASRLDHAVCQNVKAHVAILRDNDIIREKGTFVIGARYAFQTGQVEWLTPLPRSKPKPVSGRI